MDHAGTRARGLTIESRWAWLAVRVVALCFAVVGFSCDPLPPDELHTSVALLDVAREPLDIQIFRPPEALVCSKVAADPESLLTAQDFAFDSCTTLTPFTLAGLDIGSYVQDDYDPPPGIATPRSCDAVVLRAQGLADVVVFWNGVERASIDLDADNPGVDNPNVGYVNNVGAYWFLVASHGREDVEPRFHAARDRLRGGAMSRRAFAVALLLACGVSSPRRALATDDPSVADDAPPKPKPPLGPVVAPRFELGVLLGAAGDGTFKINGHLPEGGSGDSEATNFAGVSASFAQGLLPYFGYVVAGSCGSEGSSWTAARNEERTRCNLGAGPQLWLFPKVHGMQVDLRFGVPIGLTWNWINPQRDWGAHEKYSTGHGWYFGGVAGIECFFWHHGFYVDIGFDYRNTALTHRATLLSDPRVYVKDRYAYEQLSGDFGAGYAYRF